MVLVDNSQKITFAFKSMLAICLLKSSDRVQSFRQIKESSSVHIHLIAFSEDVKLFNVVLFHLNFLSLDLFSVFIYLLVLDSQFSLQLADLGLELQEHLGL